MKVLHLADLHLDSPFVGLAKRLGDRYDQLVQAPYQALERGVSFAINEAVDLVLIAGDIYNSQRQTIYAQHFFVNQMERLSQAGIPVVLGYGNHDYLTNPLRNQQLPDNVRVFADEAVTYFDLDLADQSTVRVYGFSYLHRWIQTDKIQDYPPRPKTKDYVIGLFHGQAGEPGQDQANYAPFALKDLQDKGYDYWALGHIHQAQTLSESPLIQYAGTPQGRHRHEEGAHGAYLVHLAKDQPSWADFVILSSIEWQSLSIEVQEDWQPAQVVQEIQTMMEDYQAQSQASRQSYLLTVHLTQAQRLDEELLEQIQAGELLEALTPLEEEDFFVEVVDIRLEQEEVLAPFTYDPKLAASYQEAYQELVDGELYDDIMSSVFQHALITDWMPELSQNQDLRERIIDEAQLELAEALGLDWMKGGRENED